MTKDKICDLLMYILGIIFVLMIIIFQKNLKILFICACVITLMLGILMTFKKKKTSVLAIGCSLSGIVTYIVYNLDVLSFGDSITLMLSGSMFIVLVLTLIFAIIHRIDVYKKFNLEVSAEVIDLERNQNTKKEYYLPVYQYEVDGMVYEVCDINYVNKFIPNIGDKKKLLVNSNKLDEVYFLPKKVYDVKNIVGIVSLILASLMVVISLFR